MTHRRRAKWVAYDRLSGSRYCPSRLIRLLSCSQAAGNWSLQMQNPLAKGPNRFTKALSVSFCKFSGMRATFLTHLF